MGRRVWHCWYIVVFCGYILLCHRFYCSRLLEPSCWSSVLVGIQTLPVFSRMWHCPAIFEISQEDKITSIQDNQAPSFNKYQTNLPDSEEWRLTEPLISEFFLETMTKSRVHNMGSRKRHSNDSDPFLHITTSNAKQLSALSSRGQWTWIALIRGTAADSNSIHMAKQVNWVHKLPSNTIELRYIHQRMTRRPCLSFANGSAK